LEHSRSDSAQRAIGAKRERRDSESRQDKVRHLEKGSHKRNQQAAAEKRSSIRSDERNQPDQLTKQTQSPPTHHLEQDQHHGKRKKDNLPKQRTTDRLRFRRHSNRPPIA